MLAATLAATPQATASGCWIEDAFVTEQELVAVGDTAAFLVIEQAGHSETCSTDDAVPWTTYCLGAGAGADDLDTPSIVVPEVRVLGQVIVPEQEVVPAQAIPIPADPSLVLLDDPMCTAFGDGSDPLVVGLRAESEDGTTSYRTDGPTKPLLIPIALVFPECYTPDANGMPVCYTEEYLVIRYIANIPI